MKNIKSGWFIKGIYNEACAAEGQCPFYFGRDKEGGCMYFMVIRILEGKVNGVDPLAGEAEAAGEVAPAEDSHSGH